MFDKFSLLLVLNLALTQLLFLENVFSIGLSMYNITKKRVCNIDASVFYEALKIRQIKLGEPIIVEEHVQKKFPIAGQRTLREILDADTFEIFKKSVN
uniref:AFP-like domain-containing protein n=1 Tax=Strongyloides stercoralis TaxID=6248 RepID=A0A0K0EC65_STRER